MKIAIVVDSSTGLSLKQVQKLNWYLLPLIINLDDKSYRDGIDLTSENIYQKFNAQTKATTAAANLSDVAKLFQKLSSTYDQVIVYPISHWLSSNYANLQVQAQNYDNIHVIKSESLAINIVWDLLKFEEKIAQGQSFNLALEELTKAKVKSTIYLVPYTNERLVAGGRLSPKAAALAKLLHIVPVIKFENGKLEKHSKGLNFHKVIKKTFSHLWKQMPEEEQKKTSVFIFHAQSQDLEEFSNYIQKITGAPKIYSYLVPSVLAIHTGLGAFAWTFAEVDDFARLEKLDQIIKEF